MASVIANQLVPVSVRKLTQKNKVRQSADRMML